MYSYRKIIFERPLTFVTAKNIIAVNRKYFIDNGYNYKQLTRQYKKDFDYGKIFYNFISKWLIRLPSIGIIGGILSLKPVQVYCQEFSMEDIEEEKVDLKPIEIKESNDLSHAALLRAAGRVCTDGAVLLLHRSSAAFIDKSEHYRQSLHKVMDLLDYCINIVSDKNQHDELWQYVIAARNQMEANKQQLLDLKILFDYSCLTLENASMAAFISGAEFSASISQNLITSAKQELSSEESKNVSLENQYTTIVAEHVRALAGCQLPDAEVSENSESTESSNPEMDNDKNNNETQTQAENYEKMLTDSITSEINDGNSLIGGQAKTNVNAYEKENFDLSDKNIDENIKDCDKTMSENKESGGWMSGFSEYVDYEDKKDEEVLSF